MVAGAKIATCCYCGKRAALILKGKTRHELACSGCGAPLHELKMLKTSAPEIVKPAPGPVAPMLRTPRPKRKKRRPAFSRRLIGKLFDEIEDVFDDIFD